jgi:hypothetical membrane protein
MFAMYNFWTVALLRFVVLFFIVAVSVAIYFYPGGNIHNPAQPGYSITHNFLSDLGGYHSQSGAVNFLSAFFFNLSMFMFIGVGIAFSFVPRLFKEDPLNHTLAIIGSVFFFLGTAFFAGVGLAPHDLYREMHILLAVNAFRFLVPGSIAYLVVLLRSPVENKYALVTMLYLGFTAAYVVYQLTSGNPTESQEEMVRQATIQKLIVLVSIATIFSLSFAFSSQLKHSKLH